MTHEHDGAAFHHDTDLASERLGGKIVGVSDEFFAPAENLLKPGRGEFIADKYTDHGKWMDGWESRRKRGPGHDWCLIQLGVGGTIHAVDVDTNHFLGNHPPYASIDACCMTEPVSEDALLQATWTEILPRSPLQPGSQNLFGIDSDERWTHLRLNIYPDGGVARLRVYGDALPDWDHLEPDAVIDLASITYGGKPVAWSDLFFSPPANLLMPGPSLNMGDGWETRRRRTPGEDWVVIKLGAVGEVNQVEVDTSYFKGNFPDACRLEGCYAPDAIVDGVTIDDMPWRPLLERTPLQAHERHFFKEEVQAIGPISHVKLVIIPDGGLARLRVLGTRVPQETVTTQSAVQKESHGS